MARSSDHINHNLNVFRAVGNARSEVKLNYDSGSGKFSAQTSTVSRTLGNLFKSGAKTNSVLNNATFRTPIVEVFEHAAKLDYSADLRRQAYAGLQSLRRWYTEQDKSVALATTLTEVARYLPGGAGIGVLNEQQRMQQLHDTLRPAHVAEILKPEDLAFLATVWNDRAAIYKMMRDSDIQEDMDAASDNLDHAYRPYEKIQRFLYNRYSQLAGDRPVVDTGVWSRSLPVQYVGGTPAVIFQNNGAIPRSKLKNAITSGFAGNDFVYYTKGHQHGGRLGRVYLNFELRGMHALMHFLDENADVYHLHSFKVAGYTAFRTRVDKIVIYVAWADVGPLCQALAAGASRFHFCDPCPPMTQKVAKGIARGPEPSWIDLGFTQAPDLTKSEEEIVEARKPQSYGTVRCQLITAAFAHMWFMEFSSAGRRAAYLDDMSNLNKWVAIAFLSYRGDLGEYNTGR